MKQKPGIWPAISLNNAYKAAVTVNAAAAALSQPVVCVVGPTASGKTDVAQLIATREDLLEFMAGREDASLASGWRRDIAGEKLKGLLLGDCGLTVKDGRVEIL